MTAFARVITIGRNDQMPKIVRLPIGVGVDGCTISAPVTIQPDEGVCPDCKGFGYDLYADGAVDCDRCGGGGIITLDDTEPSSVAECLAADEEGRTDVGPSSVRLPSSGNKPDALATGVPSCSIHNEERSYTISRSVSSASHSPLAPPVPKPAGAFLEAVVEAATVIGGMLLFGSLGYFFLVLA